MSRLASVADVLERRRPAHELRADLADLWRDGFHAGAQAVRDRDRFLETDLNYWYWQALEPAAHAARMRQILADYEAQTAGNPLARRWAEIAAYDLSLAKEHAHAR